MRRRSKFLLLCLIAWPAYSTTEPGSPAEGLIKKLSDITTLHAQYEQSNSLGSLQPQTGEIWLNKPNQFRLESAAPMSQTIVSNGKSLWTHDRDLEQVVVSALTTAVDIPILLFVSDPGQLNDRFEIDLVEDEQRQHYVLIPKDKNSLVERLVLTFDSKGPQEIAITNSMNERTRIMFSDRCQNCEVPVQTFQFESPAGVDLIDDRIKD